MRRIAAPVNFRSLLFGFHPGNRQGSIPIPSKTDKEYFLQDTHCSVGSQTQPSVNPGSHLYLKIAQKLISVNCFKIQCETF